MKINILTLFPEMFTAITKSSILGKANEKGILQINLVNIRDFSQDKHNKADDYPFGGGIGMVMQAEPIFGAINSIKNRKGPSIYMSPRGEILNQTLIETFAQEEEITILCGHYEGVDQRVLEHFNMKEVSIGDYILTGGELAAMVLVDSVSRLVPNVLGRNESALEESIYSGLLEYPQYTKPREFQGYHVPEVLVSGNHKLIHLWKYEQSLLITKKIRPDLFQKYVESPKILTKDEKIILQKIMEKE